MDKISSAGGKADVYVYPGGMPAPFLAPSGAWHLVLHHIVEVCPAGEGHAFMNSGEDIIKRMKSEPLFTIKITPAENLSLHAYCCALWASVFRI